MKTPAKSPLHPWEWPARPWQRAHIDFAGPFAGRSWLIIVDAYSKWPEVLPMSSTSASATVTQLRNVFATHGLPEYLVSDNGAQFTSEEFGRFLKGGPYLQGLPMTTRHLNSYKIGTF